MPARHTSAFAPRGRQDTRGPDPFVLPDAPAVATPADLSPRQHDVVALYAVGAPLKAIQRTLGINHHTVNTHLKFARAKAGVETNRELPAWYFGFTPYSDLTQAGGPLPPRYPIPQKES